MAAVLKGEYSPRLLVSQHPIYLTLGMTGLQALNALVPPRPDKHHGTTPSSGARLGRRHATFIGAHAGLRSFQQCLRSLVVLHHRPDVETISDAVRASDEAERRELSPSTTTASAMPPSESEM